jgi:hypothetical protein
MRTTDSKRKESKEVMAKKAPRTVGAKAKNRLTRDIQNLKDNKVSKYTFKKRIEKLQREIDNPIQILDTKVLERIGDLDDAIDMLKSNDKHLSDLYDRSFKSYIDNESRIYEVKTLLLSEIESLRGHSNSGLVWMSWLLSCFSFGALIVFIINYSGISWDSFLQSLGL